MLFVGHLADRITSPQPFATPWSASTQLRTADVEAMQRHLTRIGLYKDKIDGKAGMQTRAALGAYQKSGRPQGRLLAERSGAARDERGTLALLPLVVAGSSLRSPDEQSEIRRAM